MSATETTVSAPGKILLAGGYLVLESPNAGYVVAADKRFYATVQSSGPPNTIIVHSPQFHSQWTYAFQVSEEESSLSVTCTEGSNNPFVEKTLRVVLAYLHAKHKPLLSLTITIQADNDFYSVLPHLQGRERTPANVDALPKFCKCPTDETTGKVIVNKTGLGSSAALTTSLVGALYHHFFGSLNTEVIHNLAQICHCHAQGKVGSGFDISSAMYGSHIYRRFPKCVLPDLLQQLGDTTGGEVSASASFSVSTCSLLEHVTQTTWADNLVTPLSIPTGLQILLADVCGGSESPSMARKVLSWKQSQIGGTLAGTSIPYWSDLQKANGKIVDLMQKLRDEPINVEALAPLTAAEWKSNPKAQVLVELHAAFLECRHHLRSMGEAAGVPIEPPEQTELCDATMQLPGVVAALVPGAGGYDAVACVYLETSATKQAIGELWAKWSGNGQLICPLAVQATAEGIQVEPNFSVV
jgi:phosphomevalonate kinase